ncbi:ABC transporter substrate-binding protein [Pseudohoeflea coraliihabitans]|uniref:ABC transporter substrate-binding protein n=1 Tax=Pseudohoeflea coraliihabitans TaxID=2860393 RepID=A0ABS6WSC2_9HYPH|nr:ABC transporter substrate-binding protein [Pseudohoeflea sp. DP4N28-3]MBW3098848.1 ABC transporter substrate-binding protein [Pseudohoeflea sp. DP4N28-3]
MKLTSLFCVALALWLSAPGLPAAARPLAIGLAVPVEGAFAPLGAHVEEAFTLFQEAHDTSFADVVVGEDGCDEESGADSANSFIEAGVDIVVGYLCAESLAAALPILSEAGIPTLTLSVRADIIGEEARRHDWQFFRLAPPASREAEVATETIVALWADRPFALIEDGTILGRELVEAIRVGLSERGLKPHFNDNFRPGQDRQPSLARRLKAAGVTAVFVGGDRRDVAVIARDASEEGLDLQVMGGDALNAPHGEIPLPEGTLAIIASAALPGTATLEAVRLFDEAGLALDGLRLIAYAAAEICAALALPEEAGADAAAPLPLAERLTGRRFQTAMGPVRFTPGGDRRSPGFALAVWRSDGFEATTPAAVLQRGDER